MDCGFKMEVSPNPNPSADSEPLAVPPLDPDFFSDNSNDAALHETFMSDLGLDGVDFDFTFDDLYFPSESEDFLADFPLPEEGSGDHDSADRSFDVSKVLNSPSPESGNCGVESSLPCQVSGDRNSGVSSIELGCCDQKLSPPVASQSSSDQNLDGARVLNVPSPESGSCDRGFSGPESSQGSGNGGSGVPGAVNSPLLDSGNSDHSSWVPSSPNLADNSWGVVDQKVKLEDSGKNSVPKRKKEQDDSTTESRSSKFRRSSICCETANASNDEEEKKKARLMRNRESAQLSRQRKKHYVEELEEKIRSMHSTIQDLTGKISIIMAENANLRQQFGGGGMCPPPHAGMYPHPSMAPMAYPWVPCAPYVVKPQGSQVPLVPIPRLKPQAPVSAPKVKKTENKKNEVPLVPKPQQPVAAPNVKKTENKKNETKSKKVVSVSLLGMLSFMFLMGCLVPFVNIKYGGIKETVPGRSDYISNRFSDMHRRRILTVKDDLNGSNYGMGVGFDDRIHSERGRGGGSGSEVKQKGGGSKPLPGSDGYAHSRNASEPLVASLYVPRNDKLVKIDGNLIIHSVLASEKAMASHAALAKKSPKPSVSLANDVRETGLAIAGNLATAFPVSEVGRNKGRHPHLFRNPAEQHKALASGSSDTLKENLQPTSTDGKLQQWFREGLAGNDCGLSLHIQTAYLCTIHVLGVINFYDTKLCLEQSIAWILVIDSCFIFVSMLA